MLPATRPEPGPATGPPVNSSPPATLPATPGVPVTKVNLNTAGLTEFEALPEIGPALARAILDYRQVHGPFRTVSELGNVRGIGSKKLAKLIDRVCVE